MTLGGCGKETEVGSGLLGSEDLNLVTESNVLITARVINPPTLTGYFNTIVTTQLLGQTESPIFGKVESSLYSQLNLVGNNIPVYRDAVLDSMILTLALVPDQSYGEPFARHTIEVFRVTEDLNESIYFTDRTFAYDPNPIGVLRDFNIADGDSVAVYDPEIRDTVIVRNVIRILLDNRLGGRIMADSVANRSSAAFREFFKGLYIRSTTSNSMLRVTIANDIFANSVGIYYTEEAGTGRSRRYDYYLSNSRPEFHVFSINHVHDYSDALVTSAIDNPEAESDILYIQGLSGVNTVLNLEDAKKLKGNFVNYAELELTVAGEVLADSISFPVARQITLQTLNENGRLSEITDALNGRAAGSQRDIVFGGNLRYNSDTGKHFYKLNVTSYIKDLLRDQAPSDLYLTLLNSLDNPQQTAIYGNKHPVYPIKLRITYTKI